MGTVFIEQACFHLPGLRVTAQCPLIGWDCQAAVRLTAWKPLTIRQKPFFPALERGGWWSRALPQAADLSLAYENGLLSTFSSSLGLLVGHL